jgi:uncharacterized membrane protein YGL010W
MRLFPRPRKSFRGYLEQYESEHTKLGTKLTHFVGIPMIVASVPTAIVNPPLAGALFAGGWALQLIGHSVFEKSKPSFLADPYYLLIGPAWVAIEAGQLVGLLPKPLFRDEAHAEQPAATNGATAVAHP